MHNICMIGSNQLLSNSFQSLGFIVDQFGRTSNPTLDFTSSDFKEVLSSSILSHPYSLYLICSGLLRPTPILDQSIAQVFDSFLVNSIGPVVASELIFQKYDNARVFILGSESARKGSYDMTYSLAKSTLKTYVSNKRLSNNQQIVLISPSTVEDFGMTTRRHDLDRLRSYKDSHPKQRFLQSAELANVIINLFNSTDYITNVEIEINGGKFASAV